MCSIWYFNYIPLEPLNQLCAYFWLVDHVVATLLSILESGPTPITPLDDFNFWHLFITHTCRVCTFLMVPILFPCHGTNIIQIDLFCTPPSDFGPGLRDTPLILSIDDLRSISLKRLNILRWKRSQEHIWDNYLDADLTTARRQGELLTGVQKLLPEG